MITELDVTLCGTGTSSGIPIIGCDCPVCRSEDLRDRRTRCGAAIRFRDASGDPRMILLDCPPDHREHALRLGLDRCDAIFFTHNHVDHTFGLDDVRRYNAVQRSPIEILADGTKRTDVYSMVVQGFRSPLISITYLAAHALLLLHLLLLGHP